MYTKLFFIALSNYWRVGLSISLRPIQYMCQKNFGPVSTLGILFVESTTQVVRPVSLELSNRMSFSIFKSLAVKKRECNSQTGLAKFVRNPLQLVDLPVKLPIKKPRTYNRYSLSCAFYPQIYMISMALGLRVLIIQKNGNQFNVNACATEKVIVVVTDQRYFFWLFYRSVFSLWLWCDNEVVNQPNDGFNEKKAETRQNTTKSLQSRPKPPVRSRQAQIAQTLSLMV